MSELIKKGVKLLFDPDYRFLSRAMHGLNKDMDDETYLKRMFRLRMGTELDLDNPKTFNEKLQWLKLHDHRPEYTAMVDKYDAKEYAAKIIGDEYIIPTYGVWNQASEIDFDRLPEQFVLKCTHDSGGLVICHDKKKLNLDETRKKLNECMKHDYYFKYREWPYKHVKPRILAEKYMHEPGVSELKDYKIHCFNGQPRIILVCKDRFSGQGLSEDFFSETWEHLEVHRENRRQSQSAIEKPAELPQMLKLAEALSKDIPFVRVDFYVVDQHIFFGELTFFPAGGFKKFIPQSYDELMGSWITLPGK